MGFGTELIRALGMSVEVRDFRVLQFELFVFTHLGGIGLCGFRRWLRSASSKIYDVTVSLHARGTLDFGTQITHHESSQHWKDVP